jgi:hypothetical protein
LQHNEKNFLGCNKEVRTTELKCVELREEYIEQIGVTVS